MDIKGRIILYKIRKREVRLSGLKVTTPRIEIIDRNPGKIFGCFQQNIGPGKIP